MLLAPVTKSVTVNVTAPAALDRVTGYAQDSIAVKAHDATLVVRGGSLTAGAGGDGVNGVTGADGPSGGAGTAGQASQCAQSSVSGGTSGWTASAVRSC